MSPVTPFQQKCSLLRCTGTMRGAVTDPILRARGRRQNRTLPAVQQRQSPTPNDAGRVQVRVAAGHALECPGAR